MTFSTQSRAGRTASSTATRTRTRLTSTRTVAIVDAVLWSERARRSIGRALRLAARFVVSSVTPAGWLVVAAATAGLAAGIVFGWVELAAAGVAALVLVACSVPFLLGAGSYRVDLALTRERVVAGSTVSGAVRVLHVGRRVALPGRLEIPVGEGLVEVSVPLLRAGGEYRDEIVVPAYRRGVIPVGPATTVRGDPLGILRRSEPRTERSEIFVHPRTVSVPSTSAGMIRDLEGNPTTDIVDSDISFHAIREYAPGDSPRHIHWKSTAKTGQLMVRQYEETRRSRLALVVSRRADEFADDDEFELAVSAAASLSVRALRDGRELEAVTGADVPAFVANAVATTESLRSVTPRALLDAFAGIASTPASGAIETICTLAGQEVRGLSLAVVVVGSPVEIRRLRAASLAFPVAVPTLVIRCAPEESPSVRVLGSLTVVTIAILDDLRHLLARGAGR